MLPARTEEYYCGAVQDIVVFPCRPSCAVDPAIQQSHEAPVGKHAVMVKKHAMQRSNLLSGTTTVIIFDATSLS